MYTSGPINTINSFNKQSITTTDILTRGGGLNFFFFGGCVPHGFQNVGSREWIFLKKWGSWEQKFGKIWV